MEMRAIWIDRQVRKTHNPSFLATTTKSHDETHMEPHTHHDETQSSDDPS